MMDAAVGPLCVPGVFELVTAGDGCFHFGGGVRNTDRRRSAVAAIWLPGFHLGDKQRVAHSIREGGHAELGVRKKGTVAAAPGRRVIDEPGTKVETVVRGIERDLSPTRVTSVVASGITGTGVNRNLGQ